MRDQLNRLPSQGRTPSCCVPIPPVSDTLAFGHAVRRAALPMNDIRRQLEGNGNPLRSISVCKRLTLRAALSA